MTWGFVCAIHNEVAIGTWDQIYTYHAKHRDCFTTVTEMSEQNADNDVS